MLRLKSFTEDHDRPMVPPLARVPTVSLSLRARVCHPNTRTDVRLLGPCFKTGPRQPFRPRHDVSDPRRVANARRCASVQPATGAEGLTRAEARYLPSGRLPRVEPTRTWTRAQNTIPWDGGRCERRTLVASASLSAISGTL